MTALNDFRGRPSGRSRRGFPYHGEVCIDKDPQAQAIRTKAKGLLFVQKERDRSWLRPAFADYILVFRRPGDNAVPIRSDEVNNEDWIELGPSDLVRHPRERDAERGRGPRRAGRAAHRAAPA